LTRFVASLTLLVMQPKLAGLPAGQRGGPNPRTKIRGRGERRWRTIVEVTFRTQPVS